MKLKLFGIIMLLFTTLFNGYVQSKDENFAIQVDRFADIRILDSPLH